MEVRIQTVFYGIRFLLFLDLQLERILTMSRQSRTWTSVLKVDEEAYQLQDRF